MLSERPAKESNVDSDGERRGTAYPILSTTRFRLRPFALHDIAPLTSLARSHRVANTTFGIPTPYTAYYARTWIASHTQAWSTGRAIHWAAARRGEPHLLVGYAGLVDIDSIALQANLRFWVGCGVERHGYALEWSKAVINFAFNELRIERVFALQAPQHKFSRHVLEHLGMRLVGPTPMAARSGAPNDDVERWVMFAPIAASRHARQSAPDSPVSRKIGSMPVA